MLQVEAANQVAVSLDAVRIIDVAIAEEAEPVRLARLDDVAQTIGRIEAVADELDRFDARLHPLLDREDEIDAVVGLLDDFGRHMHVVAARAAIDLGDTLGVRLHHGTGEGAACLGLDFSRQLLVLDLLVALEGNAVDHGIFDHHDNDPAAVAVDLHVLEQTGLDQGLQAVVNPAGVKLAVRAGLEVGANRLRLDASVPLDLDGSHRLRGRRSGRKSSHQRGSHRHGEHDQGGEHAPPHSHSKLHAQRALVIPVPGRTPRPGQILFASCF